MPVLKHAKKKMRQDKKRALQNSRIKTVYREMLKIANQAPTQETVGQAFSSLDRAVKQHIIHKNKAARLKSGLSKLLVKGAETKQKATSNKKEETKNASSTKPVAKKTSAKKATSK